MMAGLRMVMVIFQLLERFQTDIAERDVLHAQLIQAWLSEWFEPITHKSGHS